MLDLIIHARVDSKAAIHSCIQGLCDFYRDQVYRYFKSDKRASVRAFHSAFNVQTYTESKPAILYSFHPFKLYQNGQEKVQERQTYYMTE